ncbi:hypothetical protein LUZ60_015006 [Juncus effusus]|nr:hypothetical protein LUZ60_015006 [Juncus effusus]
MSYDGSFSASVSLRRLLTRRPKLLSDPKLSSLHQICNADSRLNLNHDDLIEALADPFLHPDYTIPIVGCFRPLCERITSRAVEKLQAVPNLNSENLRGSEDEIGEQDFRVVDFYVGKGRGLRLHELACLALCRALDLASFLLRCVLNYFKFSPPPFGRIISTGLSLPASKKEINLLLEATRISYRFLCMEPKVFSELWDWSCFLDLVNLTETTKSDEELDLRWCSVQILSIVLKSSDRAVGSFGLRADEAFLCLERWKNICGDTSIEKAGLYLEGVEKDDSNLLNGISSNNLQIESLDSCDLVNSLSEMQVSDAKQRQQNGETASPFVLTNTMKKSFEVALMAVTQKWPVLLHGPVGAGKTALINKLSSGNRVLFIHMDDQMDSRTLVGSYVCTERPGEFKWNPGSLTQAIVRGYWIVFEDIDKAPSDVQSVLLPLLEGSNSFSTGHGEAVEVAESFRLFATVTTSGLDTEGRRFSALWRQVMVAPPSKDDMLDVINTWYPNLKQISANLLDTFERINSMVSYQLVGSVSAGAFTRFSLRDLLKWCKRISGAGLDISSLGLASNDIQMIYQEAVDIFAANLHSSEKRLSVMREISRMLNLPAPDSVDLTYKPIIQARLTSLQVGRLTLDCMVKPVMEQKRPFVGLRNSLQTLERISSSVKFNEPVLLVGETGTGKTTLVQNLATWLGQPLTVMNLSQQSDVTDLLGGFKPTDVGSICVPLYHEFKDLFCKTFSGKENELLFRYCEEYVVKKNWKKLLRVLQKKGEEVYDILSKRPKTKKKRPFLLSEWESLSNRLKSAQNQISSASGMSFKFIEGAFVTALRNGHWILLDEVNLAPQETLQRIGAVLDGEKSTLCLAERGDVDYVDRHLSFRLFACMNPATDAGKRELPYSFRSRFTEYFVDDVLQDDDLRLFVSKYLDETQTGGEYTEKIVKFYKAAKKESDDRLQDGARQKPQFSLRSLARALDYAKKGEREFGIKKALYDGFCMFFVTLLDETSAKIMNNLIVSHVLDGKVPQSVPFDAYFVGISKKQSGPEAAKFLENYVITRSVNDHLKNLARAVYIKRYPVLLQGPTSSGKTSLVHYLASITGHEFVRINNHEHTDLQEYFGTYITDSQGRLKFQEGVLVKAVREGHWIVLDELNLAPSDVLEALNRLLDDNRELFVPEIQETIQAHPDFMLFATQNPPVLYGGRKMLSRAFRNRFLELHVDEIPESELTTILEQRCKIPKSYAGKMVEVMKELQMHRQNSRVFAGKHGFITPRDLFRWADRFRVFGKSYDDLAKDGYLLLAERLRDESEKVVVREALERHLRVKLNVADLYKWESGEDASPSKLARDPKVQENFGNITWTKGMWRLYFLVERCYRLHEPVLLVGETGGGKTTVCQLLSSILGSRLHILNCHQYTETSDFIGGFCPIRDRSRLMEEFELHISMIKQSKIVLHTSRDSVFSSDISQAPSTINLLNEIIISCKNQIISHPEITGEDVDSLEKVKQDLTKLHQKWQAIFMWQDGPLVEAMKCGDLFLVDEISLADDSVLERLNSVLEPERKLSLAEKGGSNLEKITAHEKFFILATMNPGGDYGKKELSPALRNRFTEIWVPSVSDIDELKSIAIDRFEERSLSWLAQSVVSFWKWFNELQAGRTLTIRDLLSWISFINVAKEKLSPEYALIHGVFLVLLDGLTLGTGIPREDANKLRDSCLSFLLEELQKVGRNTSVSELAKMDNYGWGLDVKQIAEKPYKHVQSEDLFGIEPFYISKGGFACKTEGYEFLAPTTSRNVLRVLRAMQLPKPVLLEGSPGVGKTSLIVALGGFSGHEVVRINLSEQTDMMDLLGSDLPVQGENGMEFSWSDGILLQALKKGSWVLLDELNLAPQSVLEGLNSILDHRAEVFIPELNRTFKCPNSFRVFACQNPSSQGGGRKGLPKSFLNRFAKVYVDELSAEDYLFICQSRYPTIESSLLSKLITFNKRLYTDTMVLRKYGQEGSPWEFNLRDVIRSCEMISSSAQGSKDCFLKVVYLQRMRTTADRNEVIRLFEEVFESKPSLNPHPRLNINPNNLIVGNACIQRNHFQPSKTWENNLEILPTTLYTMESIIHCLNQGWLCILVGSHSSGKTSLVRLLAQLTGNALHELNLSSGTDVSELLGCFEQYNIFRQYKAVITNVERYLNEYFSLGTELNWKELVSERKGLFAKWFEFTASKKYSFSTPVSVFRDSWDKESFNSFAIIADIIRQLKHDIKLLKFPVSCSIADLDGLMKSVLELQQNKSLQQKVKFEWVAGDLIKALECGDWIVLDNANLCNPTVLDRINSLAEPDGSIVINECGLVDGNPVLLHAHPKFRMFLTVNPRHGEVSRAMRNRGVEIFFSEPNSIKTNDNNIQNHEVSLKDDVTRFLVSVGICRRELIWAMSEAHLFAKDAGLKLGVRISLLELMRWVQLFKQLLMKGNRLMWSLQLSFEHTFLPSLGEIEGMKTVLEGKSRFLTALNGSNEGLVLGGSLSLPVGWPTPLKLRDFVWYSREACVKRNCVYLESLCAQLAAYELSECVKDRGDSLWKNNNVHPSVLPVGVISQVLYPGKNSSKAEKVEFDIELVNQMLFFAANWVVEQTTDKDISLYVKWFKFYGSQLEPYCSFLSNFGDILEKEHDHPIWKCIFQWYKDIVSQSKIDTDSYPLPFLSTKLLDLSGQNNNLNNALDSVVLLRLTYQQWKAEESFSYKESLQNSLVPVLKSLRSLEREVLSEIVESKELCDVYSNIIEYHRLIWKRLVSSQFDDLALVWSFSEKEINKLPARFSHHVNRLLVERSNLRNLRELNFGTQKATLWIHGGHPFVPSFSAVFYKVQQIFTFIEDHWPRKRLSQQNENCLVVGDVLSADTELKRLAMEGACMSDLIATKFEEDDSKVVARLDDFYQGLLRRVESERKNLEMILETAKERNINSIGVSTCCSISSVTSRKRDGFLSWLSALPLLDLKSIILDIMLLPKLVSSTWLDTSQICQNISEASELVQYALNYSLEVSSRSPIEFTPYQIILWIKNAWDSVDSASIRVSSATVQMWFNFHSSLWNRCSGPLKSNIKTSYNEPCQLVHLSKTTALSVMLQDIASISDYEVNCLKLRIASRNIWEDAQLPGGLVGTLYSAADCLFKQILFVHKKHFTVEAFNRMQTVLFKLSETGLAKKDFDVLKSIISSSSHEGLNSLWDPVIKPLIKELYTKSPSTDLYNLGSAWFHIGVLRFELLLRSYGPDPAMKYAFKHSHTLEKISLIELDLKVRHECEQLSGCDSQGNDQDKRLVSLHNLESEEKKLRGKVVFRPRPSKCQKLRSTCGDFKEIMSVCSTLVVELNGTKNLQLAVDRACSWQITSENFIKRLSEEYKEYIDLIQPIQVSIYEMKLGLSAVLSSALEKQYLNKAGEENVDGIFDAISSLVEFPSGRKFEQMTMNLSGFESDIMVADPIETENIQSSSTDLLKKLVSASTEMNSEKTVSCALSVTSIHHVTLVRNAYEVCSSLVMDKPSFMMLREMFDHFKSLWLEMKSRSKNEENDDDDKLFKFKTRSINIEDVVERNILSLSESDQDGPLTVEMEERMEEEFINTAEKAAKEDENTEEEVWNLIPESTLNDVVIIHNQLFGSQDLIEQVGKCQSTDEQKLQCFMESYEQGTRIIKDLQAITSSQLDESLTPEHFLRLILENKQTSSAFLKKDESYNAYKDPNATVLFKMVEPLNVLKDRVNYYMIDWPEHPVLQRILKIAETLVKIPLNTPITKALQGLQLLVGRIQSLQETDTRFSFKAQLPPVYVLISSWQKLELESWPSLVEAVYEKHDSSAGKLWFPLRAVLYRSSAGDSKEENLFTINSIEQFVQTSSIGEFKRRMQLVLAFHSELAYSSSNGSQTLNILYNAFGYYVQFVPLVLEHIESERKSIEKELKENVKLYRWEQDPTIYSIERFKKTREKAFKLVHKINEFLQQPVMMFLNKHLEQTDKNTPSWLEQKEPEKMNGDLPQFPVDLVKLTDTERFLWYGEWKNKAYSSLQSMNGSPPVSLKDEEASVKYKWDNCWASIEKICSNAAELGYVLKNGTKNRKKRAVTSLLKTLEACGLSKHRLINDELGNQLDQQTNLFLQPSYEMEHLLLHEQSKESSKKSKIEPKTEPKNEWKSTNQCYFKCLTMIQQLHQNSLKFHKSLELEQVRRATSFMDHLMSVLSEQRNSAYGLFEQLIVLKDHLVLLDISSGSLTSNQHAVLMCMWQQKRLFDSLLSMLRDTNLLLGLVKDCHLSKCDLVRAESATVSSLIETFLPRFTQCKDLLDKYLIGESNVLASTVKKSPLATKDMEQALASNWQTMCSFEEGIESLGFERQSMRSVMHVLIGRFRDVINKGKKVMDGFYHEVEANIAKVSDKLESLYPKAFGEAVKIITDVFGRLNELGKGQIDLEEEPTGNITLWKDLLRSHAMNLKIDQICASVDNAVIATRKAVQQVITSDNSMEVQLKQLSQLVGLALSYGDGILSEFLSAHKTTCEMTHALGQVLNLLFTDGFGSIEETTEEGDGKEEAKGTGMGEGEGAKDVSDEIEDESQLQGTKEKQEGADKTEEAPSGKDKGIEMDEDFNGDMCSVSEDSEDENQEEDEEEPNIESQMGDAGENKEAVSEKPFDDDDKDEDENQDGGKDKYENGPAVKEKDESDRELTAKDENDPGVDNTEELDLNERPEEEGEEEKEKGKEDEKENNEEGMEMDKNEAFKDPTGVEFQEPEIEDEKMEEAENTDLMEQDGDENEGETDEEKEGEGEENPNEMEEDIPTEEGNEEGDVKGAEIENTESKEETENSENNIESVPQPSQAMQMNNFNGLDPNLQPEANWANTNDASTSLAPGEDSSKMEINVPDSTHGSRFSSDSKPQDSQENSFEAQKNKTNPFRSMGDAMEEWKERAKVSADQDEVEKGDDDVSDENADEYMYVNEGEKSTSQALGAATADQTVNEVEDGGKLNPDEENVRKKEDRVETEENPEPKPYLKACQSLAHKGDISNENNVEKESEMDDDSVMEEGEQGGAVDQSGDLVLFARSYMDEKITPFDDNLLNIREKLSDDVRMEISSEEDLQRAVVEWKRHELSTTRLSQELAEQLRLVMEPTLASKLQGDYRTGKRINMKKVIPYIASHFRKDKIWLRRTKPNKRNYQVVIAVDDSRSMSESQCGKVAIEALVTVCRAMSQLEVGQFAVASFGERGNVKVLHDFDQSFTTESGIKMISSLSFKQDNTIADEPVVDLLKYMNSMLDTAVAKSRTPSGQNPLEQLILIIADGRFHEKENLRRCVRDALSRKRMVAFILLDSPQESIMDLMEASFEGEKLSFSKYLNSFPFPYYIVLKNIEALPRTLADLLRQWFELMQSLNE